MTSSFIASCGLVELVFALSCSLEYEVVYMQLKKA